MNLRKKQHHIYSFIYKWKVRIKFFKNILRIYSFSSWIIHKKRLQWRKLIGRQIEMYQEKERILPVENEFQRSYFRTINVKLPEGYTIVNPEDLKTNKVFLKDGKEMLVFNSFYEIKDGMLSIIADEHYRMNIIGTEEYEEYRTVNNSAADFYKISLVLEPAIN